MPEPDPPGARPPSAWSDLARPPLRERALARALEGDEPWRRVRVVAATGSTNADVAERARAGEAEGLVLVAEHQTAGRGRLDRTWTAPPRSGLTLSVLLRPGPGVPVARWGWVPLLAGVAVAHAVTRAARVDVRLKWPNDVQVGGRKVAGLLAERAGDAVVVGIGLNVSLTAQELPSDAATSLAMEGARTLDRDTLLRALLRELGRTYRGWRLSGGDPAAGLRDAYVERCATVGRRVRVLLPGGAVLEGEAVDVDADGRLVVAHGGGDGPGAPDGPGLQAVAAGDVVHVR
ncbi:biotin--[acetyl-CoA-carboxylase] ligase [Vallicoccus soli]|uniref:biotin--[biotin carboxyl-carrier protein] ligase n=1 Tax=Vallicoccus soli TaxID=2339232 RepID=A0A3A3Z442_9ACTN|nr:biotin--[acetyl-CoA-carboxylase] ligase [Vallicoccus soli]RJK95317.1 biotin--[acetyl-CoA-carboxylase] ligase [Vallicoccus soli]